jgi:sporulation protein YlmC with PRC-barrel domain
MTSEPLYGYQVLDKRAYDLAGNYVGRVADVIVERAGDGRYRITEVVVSGRPWGRLLGYEREQQTGPWLLEKLADAVLRRDIRRLPWSAVRIGD